MIRLIFPKCFVVTLPPENDESDQTHHFHSIWAYFEFTWSKIKSRKIQVFKNHQSHQVTLKSATKNPSFNYLIEYFSCAGWWIILIMIYNGNWVPSHCEQKMSFTEQKYRLTEQRAFFCSLLGKTHFLLVKTYFTLCSPSLNFC